MAIEPVRRSDFTQSVVHLTRDRHEYHEETPAEMLGLQPKRLKQVVPAYEVLKEIIRTGVLKASGNEGFVKGKQKAVCFSEIPLSAIREYAIPPEEKTGRYRFHGIALSKRTVFGIGGRPVIYIPDSEADWIPDDQKWRQVRFEYGSVDFTHEREWRIPGHVDLTKVPGLYVLVWSTDEARELETFPSPVSKLVRGILPMEPITTIL